MHQKTQKNLSKFKPAVCRPIPRTLTIPCKQKNWKGCVYLSPSDLTGQVMEFLKKASPDYSGSLLRKPIYVFTATSRAKLDSLLSKKIRSLI